MGEMLALDSGRGMWTTITKLNIEVGALKLFCMHRDIILIRTADIKHFKCMRSEHIVHASRNSEWLAINMYAPWSVIT